jgi:hypothetical protein
MKPIQLIALALFAVAGSLHAAPFGTAFTYQGHLADAGQPANGSFEFEFGLWTALTGGTSLDTETKEDVAVTNGLFTVELDFDARAFNGEERWLEIKARRSGVANYTTLTPRQRLAPTPHALHARNAGFALTVADGSITSAKLAAGAVTAANIASNTITAAQLAPGAVGFPQLAKPYQSGRIPSSALPLGFGDYFLLTNFPTAFSTTPTLAFGVAQVGSIVGAPPQVFPLAVTPTNFAARVAQPPLTFATVSTVSLSNGITFLSAGKTLGRPAVVYAALACELVEIVTCVTNFNSIVYHFCTSPIFGGGDSNECYQASLEIQCSGSGSYPTNCAGGLRFAAAYNNAATIWINSTITTNPAVQFPSLALTALPFQSPMVAWYETNSTSLYFSRASSADGSVWPAPVQVVNHSDVGRYCSLGLVNGNPAISYYNAGARNLEFIRATNSFGAFNAAARVVVDGAVGVGRYSSLATIQGRPAIACYDTLGIINSIAFYRATDVNGASWGARRVVAPTSQALGNERIVALAEVNGLPAIAYFDPAAGQVKFVRALNVDGTAWSAPTASFPATAGDCELEVINGRPTLLFHNGSQVRIATAQDADGSAWSPPVTPALGSLSPTLGGLIANGSVPGVFYATSGTNQTLRYVSPFAQQFILNWIAVEP